MDEHDWMSGMENMLPRRSRKNQKSESRFTWWNFAVKFPQFLMGTLSSSHFGGNTSFSWSKKKHIFGTYLPVSWCNQKLPNRLLVIYDLVAFWQLLIRIFHATNPHGNQHFPMVFLGYFLWGRQDVDQDIDRDRAPGGGNGQNPKADQCISTGIVLYIYSNIQDGAPVR